MDKRQQLRQMLRKEVANLRALDRAVSLFHPDVVYVWRMAHVSISVVARAARRGYPVCFFVSDSWLADWETDLWYSRAQAVRVGWKRALLGALRTFGLVEPSMSLDLSHVQFASEYLKTAAIERGKRVHDARVIHWGVDLDAYPFRAVRRQPLRLLYVGQVIPHKGVHTAIQALKHVMEAGAGSVTLTVAGGSIIPDYARAMRVLVKELNLEGRVNFTGSLPREKVQELYLSHDILVFPSVWDEPFSITMLEAMSSGMALVSTLTGGTGEILQDGVNALAFPKEDAAACARQILRLIRETELLERIRVAARREVESAYSFESMVDQIEDSLVLARKERMSA